MENSQVKIKPAGTTIKSRYILKKVVFGGKQSIIYSAEDIYTKKNVTVKEYNLEMEYSFEAIQNRLIQLGKIEGLAQVFDVFDFNEKTYVIMEYIDGASASQFLISNKGLKDSQLMINMVLPVIKAVEQLHNKDIIHNSISVENIMITSFGQAVLVDFDEVTDLKNNDLNNTNNNDIFNLCATVFNLITGHSWNEKLLKNKNKPAAIFQSFGININEITAKAIVCGLSSLSNSSLDNLEDLYNALLLECNSKEKRNRNTNKQKPIYPKYPDNNNLSFDNHSQTDKLSNGNLNNSLENKNKANKIKNIAVAFSCVSIVISILIIAVVIKISRNSNLLEDSASDNNELLENTTTNQDDVDDSNKEYDNAIQVFNTQFSDSPQIIQLYDDAVSVFMELSDYSDSKQRLYDISKIYLNNDKLDKSIEILMFLDNYNDSLDVLFDIAEKYIEDKQYDKALNLCNMLEDKNFSSKKDYNELKLRCEFDKIYSEYIVDENCDTKAMLKLYLDKFESFNDYYSNDFAINSSDVISSIKLKLCKLYVDSQEIDEFDEAIEMFCNIKDYDNLEKIANIYIQNELYENAIDVYKKLANLTGDSYDKKIHTCMSNNELKNKYSRYDENSSEIYDDNIDKMQSYVSKECLEENLENIYGNYVSEAGSDLSINVNTINDKAYGIINTKIYKDCKKIKLIYYYIDEPNKESELIYDSDCVKTIQHNDADGVYEEDYYFDSITIDNEIYERQH